MQKVQVSSLHELSLVLEWAFHDAALSSSLPLVSRSLPVVLLDPNENSLIDLTGLGFVLGFLFEVSRDVCCVFPGNACHTKIGFLDILAIVKYPTESPINDFP